MTQDVPDAPIAAVVSAPAGTALWRSPLVAGRAFLSNRLLRQSAWIAAAQLGAQVLRLATNVVLARLVAPELFGIMLIVNSVRMGIELLSDVGIGQNIVRHAQGGTSDFLSTAWTLQIVRGLGLTVLGVAFAYPLSRVYSEPILLPVFIACSCIFGIEGFLSPGRFVYQRDQKVRELAMFHFGIAVINAVVTIGVILVLPTIWGLVIALILSLSLGVVLSYRFPADVPYRLFIDRRYAWDIVSYGKWVFVSSAVFFASMNFDRLYLGTAIPLAALGLYAVARSFSEALTGIVSRAQDMILFPRVAQAHNRGDFSRATLRRPRRIALLLVAVGLGSAIAVSDLIIGLFYDSRYAGAALILPVLLFGSWFNVLSALSDGVTMGTGRPIVSAMGNVAKIAWMVASVPLALRAPTLLPAVVCIALADLVRYLVLGIASRRWRLSFFRLDSVLTLGLIAWIVAARAALVATSIVPGWWPHPAMAGLF